MDYNDYLFKKDPEQYSLMMELICDEGTMDYDDFERKYNSLDAEFREMVNDDLLDFADNAIGDPSWRSDE